MLTDVYSAKGLKFTIENLRMFAPEMAFHPCEPYLPISIETLLNGATLYGSGGVVILNPTQQDMAARSDSNSTLVLNSARYAGEALSTAPIYVSVQVPDDKSYVDLNYIILYAFNGCQTMRNVTGAPGHFNYMIRDLAQHEGDLEVVTVRVTPDFSAVIQVRYEAHGDPTWYNPDAVDWTAQTHPKARVALNSHGNYNGHGKNPNDWITLADAKLAEVVDIITDGGAVWRPYERAHGVRLLALDTNRQPLGNEQWAAYKGRLGTNRTNEVKDVLDVCGTSLDFFENITAKTQAYAAATWQAYIDLLTLAKILGREGDFFKGVAPEGPGNRPVLGEVIAFVPPPPPTPQRDFIATQVIPQVRNVPSDEIAQAFAGCDEGDCDVRSYGGGGENNWARFFSKTTRTPSGGFWWNFELTDHYGWMMDANSLVVPERPDDSM